MNADLVPEGSRLADIGCDHGYVPMYLAEKKRCRKIVAMDIREGPLAAAERNIRRAHLQKEISCRLSDGLEALLPNEADTVLLAGMGGMLICRILRDAPGTVRGIDTLILQPQSDWAAVRRTIWALGFFIEDEQMCIDDGKYYFAIRASRGRETAPYTEEECTYGRLLPGRKSGLFRQWLQREKEKRETVISHLQGQESPQAAKRREELYREQEQIQKILTDYYGG